MPAYTQVWMHLDCVYGKLLRFSELMPRYKR